MREQPGEAQVRRVGDEAGNLHGLARVRLDAAAVVAAIDLQEEVERQPRASRRVVEQRRDAHVVRDEREAFAELRQLDRLVELPRLDGNRVGDVFEAVRREGARLGERGDGNAARARLGLDARHLDTLMRLDVRAQGSPEPSDARRHPLRVPPHAPHVQDERRRLDVVQVHNQRE